MITDPLAELKALIAEWQREVDEWPIEDWKRLTARETQAIINRSLSALIPGIEKTLAYTDWVPTSENINHLPDSIRTFIHDLETRCDPAGDVQSLACLKENVKALEQQIATLCEVGPCGHLKVRWVEDKVAMSGIPHKGYCLDCAHERDKRGQR